MLEGQCCGGKGDWECAFERLQDSVTKVQNQVQACKITSPPGAFSPYNMTWLERWDSAAACGTDALPRGHVEEEAPLGGPGPGGGGGDTSSTISVVALFQRCLASKRLALRRAEATSEHLPTPAKACRVVPPRAQAASPVEAVTKVESPGRALTMCFSTSDLPVPAAPHISEFREM